jgi:hypothetical protein
MDGMDNWDGMDNRDNRDSRNDIELSHGGSAGASPYRIKRCRTIGCGCRH